jgi:hypothetical protein
MSAEFRFPLGIEWVKMEHTLKPVRFSWSRTTVADVIQAVVSMHTGYDWRTEDDVVHVFQRELMNDKRNPLNITIKEFDQQPETVAWASNDLYQMVSHVVRHPFPNVSAQHTGKGGSRVAKPRHFRRSVQYSQQPRG